MLIIRTVAPLLRFDRVASKLHDSQNSEIDNIQVRYGQGDVTAEANCQNGTYKVIHKLKTIYHEVTNNFTDFYLNNVSQRKMEKALVHCESTPQYSAFSTIQYLLNPYQPTRYSTLDAHYLCALLHQT